MAKITLLRSTASYNRRGLRHHIPNSNNKIIIVCFKLLRIFLMISICGISKVKSYFWFNSTYPFDTYISPLVTSSNTWNLNGEHNLECAISPCVSGIAM